MSIARTPLLSVTLAGALALGACSKSEPDYQVDATDKSGGELIVATQTPQVPVTLPETTMTPVPTAGASATPAPAAPPS